MPIPLSLFRHLNECFVGGAFTLLKSASARQAAESFAVALGGFALKQKSAPKPVPFAIVHHANQYLITDGYENRHGVRATLGSVESKTGFSWILELHRRYGIPANLHISGTLLETIAWHQPGFLRTLQELYKEGLLEIVGSCYGQNIMRFFSYDHNLRQLNEELRLYQIHLDLDLTQVRTFWPPERVWDTERMAPVLSDPRLMNKGYKYLCVDDRLLFPVDGNSSPRRRYDKEQPWDPQLFQMYRIEEGHGLIALPIANNLRQSIPPTREPQWTQLRNQLRWLSTLNSNSPASDLIAVYGDDLEKAAGLGAWDKGGPAGFETLLDWLKENPWVEPVRISEWCSTHQAVNTRPIEVGTFYELANHFAAGEGYENWYFDPQWSRYREYFSWTASRVNELSLCGADPSLMELAEKHLLASSWESAWHTPAEGPFGNPEAFGHPSPWIKALASHSRHAAVIAEAAHWMRHKDQASHAYLFDVDADGEEELVVKNDKLVAVFTPRWGGRLIALFSVEGPQGRMVVGNPSDDWNWMEELNRYMEIPPNHPGAFTDLGFEHDINEAQILIADGPTVQVELRNKQPHSGACGLRKLIRLAQGESVLHVQYALPEKLRTITIEFGLSPDYLSLLRHGRCLVSEYEQDGARGWSARDTTVWVKPENCAQFSWSKPYAEEFGHKSSLRLSTSTTQFSVSIGVNRT